MKWGTFMRDTSFTKLKFVYNFSYTAASATAPVQGFSIPGNGLNVLPAAVNGGSLNHTPARNMPVGNVTLGTMYNKYKIFGSSYRAEIWAQTVGGVNNNAINFLSIFPINSTGGFTFTFDQMATIPYTTKRVLSSQLATTPRGMRVKAYMSTRKIEGVTQAEFEGSNYLATTGAGTGAPTNPTGLWNWYFMINNFAGGNLAPVAMSISLTMTYYVKYYNVIHNTSIQ